MKFKSQYYAFLLPLLFFSCSGLEQSEQNRIKKINTVKERIYRLHDERCVTIEIPKPVTLEPYAWEKKRGKLFPAITKEYFRCKGTKSNPPLKQNNTVLYDCGGFDAHSLPVMHDTEYIYPVLVDLLNHVQNETDRKVVITCGHRCPDHNRYAEPRSSTSLHMIGAEVDFYVEGCEQQPEKIVEILQAYYKNNDSEYKKFNRYNKPSSCATPPWYNKEIFIKLYAATEGRDGDNSHPYPYITIQLRHNRADNRPVTYNWHKANCSFYRW